MRKKRLGCICFLLADFSEKSQYVIKLINHLGHIIPGSVIAIVSDNSFKKALTSFSDRIKLYNISMCENRNGKSVSHALLQMVRPELLIVLPFDEKATSFANYARLDTKLLTVGDKPSIGDREIQVTFNEDETAAFIITHIEESRNLDFYPKCYVHEKALNSQLQPGEFFNAVFRRRKRVEADFLSSWGYNLPKQPQTYNEKLNYLKINGHYRKYRKYADKSKVRTLLKKMGYEHLLPECYITTDFHISSKAWDCLPERFIIKHSNSSGYNLTVNQKSTTDLGIINRVLKCLKHVKYGLRKNEPVYPLVGKIICTEFIDAVTDYKFFCFNGKVMFIAIVKEWLKENPSKEPYQVMVDRDFNELPFSYGYERGTVAYEKPPYFGEMLATVEKLSANIPHVRLDMMGTEDRFYFGEYTFFPGGGKDRFYPPEYDLTVGKYIQ